MNMNSRTRIMLSTVAVGVCPSPNRSLAFKDRFMVAMILCAGSILLSS